MSDVVLDKITVIILSCGVFYGCFREHPVLDVVVVVESLCGYPCTLGVELNDAIEQRFGERSFAMVQRIAAYGLTVETHLHAFEQGVVGLQYTKASTFHGIFARPRNIFEVHSVCPLFVTVSRIAVDLGVEGTVMMLVGVRNKVAVGVHRSVKCPSHDVAVTVFDDGVVYYLTLNTTEIRCGAVFGSDFPRIVCGRIAPADDARETALDQRVETLVWFSCRRFGRAVGAVAQLRAHQQVTLALVVGVETWYAPARLDVHALHG